MPAYVWWAYLLSKENFRNYIISTSSISINTINKIKPDAIVWCYARPQNSFLIRHAFLKGIRNIIHDTEGISYRCDDDFYNSCDNLTLKSIHSIWCWGDEQKNLIDKRCLSIGHKSIAIKIGSIRYEYYKQLKFGNIKKNNILVNTNFPIISPKYGNLDSDYKIWVNIEKKLSRSEYIQRCINLSAMRQSLINFIYYLVDKNLFNPEQIILRTHPYESEDYYHELKKLGILISNENDIAEDISKCFLMAQCGCQTVLDGLIQEVPSILIKPNYENIWSDISIKFDEKDLTKIIQDKKLYLQLKNDHIKKARKIVEPYLANINDLIQKKSLIFTLNDPLYKKTKVYIYIYFINFFTKIIWDLKNIAKKIIYKKKINKSKLNNKIIIQYLKSKEISFKTDSNKNIYFENNF